MVCLRKEMQFKKYIVLDTIMVITNCVVTLVIAVSTGSTIAVILGQISGATIYVIASYYFHPFRFYDFCPKDEMRNVFNFSKWLMLSGQINILIQHGISFLIAFKFGSVQVSFLIEQIYSRGKQQNKFQRSCGKQGFLY